MTLIDISKLNFEPFLTEDGETVDYISAEELYKAPKVDPVNHAEWAIETRGSYSESDKMFVYLKCSHCGEHEHTDIIPKNLWEMGYKDQYKPKGYPYCRNCGCKMDLRDWCEARGYILEDMHETKGVNGECYACFTEWYNNEYLESRGA